MVCGWQDIVRCDVQVGLKSLGLEGAMWSKFRAPNNLKWEGCMFQSALRTPLSSHGTCPFVHNGDCGEGGLDSSIRW